jgi:hypothetical protein
VPGQTTSRLALSRLALLHAIVSASPSPTTARTSHRSTTRSTPLSVRPLSHPRAIARQRLTSATSLQPESVAESGEEPESEPREYSRENSRQFSRRNPRKNTSRALAKHLYKPPAELVQPARDARGAATPRRSVYRLQGLPCTRSFAISLGRCSRIVRRPTRIPSCEGRTTFLCAPCRPPDHSGVIADRRPEAGQAFGRSGCPTATTRNASRRALPATPPSAQAASRRPHGALARKDLECGRSKQTISRGPTR